MILSPKQWLQVGKDNLPSRLCEAKLDLTQLS